MLNRLKHIFIALFFFTFSVSFAAENSNRNPQEQNNPPVDILIFSPHPDDETIACAGVILQAKKSRKTVKIVFLTNGDAPKENCAAWSRKKQETLLPDDFILLGKQRQIEALKAAGILGLEDKDIVFLSYPDKGLLALWEQEYNSPGEFIESEATQKAASPYPKTYHRAKNGYSRKNLLMDIKDILKQYTPQKIYTPYSEDNHSDHVATAYFVNLALEELQKEGASWVRPLDVNYYLCHPNSFNQVELTLYPNISLIKDSTASGQNPSTKDEADFIRNKKTAAIQAYSSQLILEKDREYLEKFIPTFKNRGLQAADEVGIPPQRGGTSGTSDFRPGGSIADKEVFWQVATDKNSYLAQLEDEWFRAAKLMRKSGFNVNLSPVVDVPEDIEDLGVYIARRKRAYSDDPRIVTQLAFAQIRGMVKAGVIPVIKHFPGLGSVRADTHAQLPLLEADKADFYKKDLIPFQELIKTSNEFWIMVDHAVYSCFDKEPASLSYNIQTKLLRGELGFKGIIIADELSNMQAISEYAYRQKIQEPYIGEIIVKAFAAGIDLALIYPPPGGTDQIINQIIKSVTQAVNEGRLKEDDIDSSVERILKEKERIFNRPLTGLLKAMTLESKICQKLVLDSYNYAGVFKKYNFGGIRPKSLSLIKEAQINNGIPLFILAQHEGGAVKEPLLKILTRSSYVMGKEFARLSDNAPEVSTHKLIKETAVKKIKTKEPKILDYNKLAKPEKKKIIFSLINSLDMLIAIFSQSQDKYPSSTINPNYISPLTFRNNNEGLEIQPFKDVPAVWLRNFQTQEQALCAYGIFKKILENWKKKERPFLWSGVPKVLLLNSLKKETESFLGLKSDKSNIRVLCLAAHPDDEDAELLAYFSKEFKCPTYVLLATRGEGGENEISPALDDELGVLRTEEMIRSAGILGIKRVYYLGKKDFGYTVDAQEAFKIWDKADTLKKLVYFIRLIRPHIIITRHNPHEYGQHKAFAILFEEAFDLAGEANSYPDLIKEGLLPWKPVKLYERFQGQPLLGAKTIVFDQDQKAPMSGLTYRQIGIEAMKQHRSQGDYQWQRVKDKKQVYYLLTKSSVKFAFISENTFFDWIIPETFPEEAFSQAGRIIPSGIPGIKIVDNLRIGLIEKNNNAVFVGLTALGVDFKPLGPERIKKNDLAGFDTIIVSQGAYALFSAPPEINQRLLQFVKNGGNLVIFSQFIKGQPAFPYAPKPFTISVDPVTDENSPLEILQTEHTLFNFPNKISSADFTGWVQERGFAFASKYPPDSYAELLSCASAKGDLIKGGYLIMRYGKGSYIYTSYSWLRQFKVFHLGAYKNLANMLSYPRASNGSYSKTKNE